MGKRSQNRRSKVEAKKLAARNDAGSGEPEKTSPKPAYKSLREITQFLNAAIRTMAGRAESRKELKEASNG